MKPNPNEIRRKARRITRRADLPKTRSFARYQWTNDHGEECATALQKRDRQVAEALMAGPLFCASPVRVSDSVLRLRRDHGLPVETEFFSESNGEEKLTFGVYWMAADVKREGAE